jgi:hypothetical protein
VCSSERKISVLYYLSKSDSMQDVRIHQNGPKTSRSELLFRTSILYPLQVGLGWVGTLVRSVQCSFDGTRSSVQSYSLQQSIGQDSDKKNMFRTRKCLTRIYVRTHSKRSHDTFRS